MTDDDKISAAVEKCLAYAIGSDQPYARVREFLDLLAASPEWSDPQIIVVQHRVIRALLHRLYPDENQIEPTA